MGPAANCSLEGEGAPAFCRFGHRRAQVTVSPLPGGCGGAAVGLGGRLALSGALAQPDVDRVAVKSLM